MVCQTLGALHVYGSLHILTATPLSGSNAVLLLMSSDNVTVNGNARGAACVFPFLYRGTPTYSCTAVNYDKLWCSTTPNYDQDRLWGECLSYACVFPFLYRGTPTYSCTAVNYDRLWCSTTPNYDQDRLWGECLSYGERSDDTLPPL
uniref:Fibronectin type-II domain-containing protein n=1 Tax=Denticeps clupeoides TaxID=299321 RepID=A0AAY4A8L1_9TELE